MAVPVPRESLRDYQRAVASSAQRRDTAREALRGMRTVNVDAHAPIIGDTTRNGTRRIPRNRDRLAHHMIDHAYVIDHRSRVSIAREGTLHVSATLAALTAYRERRASNRKAG